MRVTPAIKKIHFNQGDVSLDEQADFFRLDVLRQVGREQRKALGQFFTPPYILSKG